MDVVLNKKISCRTHFSLFQIELQLFVGIAQAHGFCSHHWRVRRPPMMPPLHLQQKRSAITTDSFHFRRGSLPSLFVYEDAYRVDYKQNSSFERENLLVWITPWSGRDHITKNIWPSGRSLFINNGFWNERASFLGWLPWVFPRAGASASLQIRCDGINRR